MLSSTMCRNITKKLHALYKKWTLLILVNPLWAIFYKANATIIIDYYKDNCQDSYRNKSYDIWSFTAEMYSQSNTTSLFPRTHHRRATLFNVVRHSCMNSKKKKKRYSSSRCNICGQLMITVVFYSISIKRWTTIRK